MSLEGLRDRLARRRAELHARGAVVLAGGSSAERDISLISGHAVATALQQRGLPVELLAVNHDDITFDPQLSSLQATPALSGAAPDVEVAQPGWAPDGPASIAPASPALIPRLRRGAVVFTTLHGTRGEDGVWQGLLELLDVPYVSANVKGSVLGMDKLVAKQLCQQLGVPTPRFWVMRAGRAYRDLLPPEVTELVAKPTNQGSSVGIEMVNNDDEGWARIAALNERFDPLLIEQRIYGRELTAGVIGLGSDPLPLPLVEIRPRRAFYDYTAKYTSGESEYICPAELPDAVVREVQAHALTVFREFELEPYARMDFILDADSRPWFLEANTLPGFTPLSLLPRAAQALGIDFQELLELLLLVALERWEQRHGGAK